MTDNSILEKLVESILLELLEAQNASNKASAKLAENYLNPKTDSVLEYFPVPNSSIKAFDFALKFALKDIGIVLTDDAISNINDLIAKTWGLYLGSLVHENVISERSKNVLLKQIPFVDFNSIKTKVSELASQEKCIASFLEREILLSFISALPRKSRRKKEGVTKSSMTLNLQQQINQILFSSKKEQEIPLSDFKAVFDLNKLNNTTEDIICSINVHVEMRNFQSAYYQKHDNTEGKDDKIKGSARKKILTLIR